MSAHLFLVEFADRRLVARFPSPYLATFVPDPVTYEAATLRALARQEVDAPRVVATDGEMVVLTYCDGAATANPAGFDDYYGDLARRLAEIHRTPTDGFEHLVPMKPNYTPRPEPWRTDLSEADLVSALQALPAPDLSQRVLRHGDFWPGNVLWQDGHVSAVIDWENALLGPAVADLAISQLDMMWIGGRAAMQAFTDAYLAARDADLRELKYWQIRATLRPMPNFDEWAGPYASLDRPDITTDTMQAGLLEFIEEIL
ncbi:MAG: aminoglycoside phosphotransferase family protein [Chthonomonas sp.]|nr:aminoglycoside phosphotransferase family protein [Chthonomonas sp.]